MKKVWMFVLLFVLILGFSLQAFAVLEVRGTDSLGNQLIYDSDLDITWYDYSSGPRGRDSALIWTWNLTVDFGEQIYSDWRLPISEGPSGSDELYHLFYTELGNTGAYDINGNQTGCGFEGQPSCLTSTGPFTHLVQTGIYWYDDERDYGGNWQFYLYRNFKTGQFGELWYVDDPWVTNGTPFGIAVRDGDVTIVPEPISSILFLTGGAALIGRKYIRRKKIEV